MLSVGYSRTAVVRVSTFVPHAKDMTVAAITDITLAAFNLFPNIVALIVLGVGRAKRLGEAIAY